LRRTMQEWAGRDPDGARAWLESCPDLYVRGYGMRQLIEALAMNPETAETALRYAWEWPNAGQRAAMVGSLGRQFASHPNWDRGVLVKAIEQAKPFEGEAMLSGMTGVLSPEVAREVITLKLDERVLNRVRHLAVDEDKSVSAWVTELIEGVIKDRDHYEACRQRALDILDQGLHLGGKPLRREAVYDR